VGKAYDWRYVVKNLVLVAFIGLALIAVSPKYKCVERKEFSIGNSTLGIEGTYCVKREWQGGVW